MPSAARKKKKPQSFCAEACALSAVLCEQRAAGGALREQRGRKPSEKRREIAADRAIFPACGALNWLACGAFRSACGARREPGQSARPAAPLCYSRLLRARSRGELAWVLGFRSEFATDLPVVVQQIGLLGGFRLFSASFWLLLVRACAITSDTEDCARF